MKKSEINPRMRKWADLMVNHSLGEQFKEKNDSIEGKLVVVHGEYTAEPLMLALSHSILKAGGHPYLDVFLSTHYRGTNAGLPEMESGTKKQLTYVPKFIRSMFEEAGAQIYIGGTNNPFITSCFPKKVAEIRKSNRSLMELRLSKPWLVTLFPTHGDSISEGFSTLGDYEKFVMDASLVDYVKMKEDQKPIKELMENSQLVRLKTYDSITSKVCDLEIEIGDNLVKICAGEVNVPDGEVFTSPNSSRINGKVVLDIPVANNGVEISNVYLDIKDGKIIDYRAEKGQAALKTIIETDKGSNMIGEFAVGTNPNVQRALKHPLFAEKIGGTCHLAIGSPYEDCYNELEEASEKEKEKVMSELISAGRFHKSAQHVDIPTDFRNPIHGQELYIGDTQIEWDNKSGLWEIKK